MLIACSVFHRNFARLRDGCRIAFPRKESFACRRILRVVPRCSILYSVFSFPMGGRLVSRTSGLGVITGCTINCGGVSITCYLRGKVAITGAPSPIATPATGLTLNLVLSITHHVARYSHGLHQRNLNVGINILRGLNVGIAKGALKVVNVKHVKGTLTHQTGTYNVRILCRGHQRLCIRRRAGLGIACISGRRLLSRSSFISLGTPCAPRACRVVNRTRLGRVGPATILVGANHNPLISRGTLIRTLGSKAVRNTNLSMFRFNSCPSPRLLRVRGIILAPRVKARALRAHVVVTHAIYGGMVKFLRNSHPISQILHP